MILAGKKNDVELMALVPSIKNFMNEWQIVNIKVIGDSQLSQGEIIKQMMKQYAQYEGLIYSLSAHKVVMLVRMGVITNYAVMKSGIEKNIPGHNCYVMVQKMSGAGLKQVQIDLTHRPEGAALAENMFDLRNRRKENIIVSIHLPCLPSVLYCIQRLTRPLF